MGWRKKLINIEQGIDKKHLRMESNECKSLLYFNDSVHFILRQHFCHLAIFFFASRTNRSFVIRLTRIFDLLRNVHFFGVLFFLLLCNNRTRMVVNHLLIVYASVYTLVYTYIQSVQCKLNGDLLRELVKWIIIDLPLWNLQNKQIDKITNFQEKKRKQNLFFRTYFSKSILVWILFQ